MTIVIAGGSGFIGTKLTQVLLTKGHTVIVIDRQSPVFTNEKLFFIQCDLTKSPLPYNVLERTDVVINLVGAPISKRWTSEYKSLIRTTRTKSTRAIVDAIAGAQTRPTVFISASAIGFYGETGEQEVDERAPQGTGFLAEVVGEWEGEARRAQEYGVRTVIIRTAPVLGRGGLISSLTKTTPFGFLVKLTKKNYWFSWIHEQDIVNVYVFAVETTTIQGTVNAVAPEAIRNTVFMKYLGAVLHRVVLGTLPRFIAQQLFGELFEEITKSARVAPTLLLDKGFAFQFPDIKSALKDIFKEKTVARTEKAK